jgi:hypothetical protein
MQNRIANDNWPVFLRRSALLAEYIALIVYFIYLWATGGPDEAEIIGNIVFAQFFGVFLTVILAFQFIQWSGLIGQIVVTLVYGGLGLSILVDLSDGNLIVAGIWFITIINSLLADPDDAFVYALLHGLGIMAAAFIAALIGSMAGVDPDTLLLTDIGTTALWGILYYGVLVIEMFPPQKRETGDHQV